MSFDPATLIAGPAIITHDSQVYYSQGDISVVAVLATWDVNTSMHGPIDRRLKSRAYDISFTPAGEVENFDKYFPYSGSNIGAGIFAAVDKDLVIQTLAGQKYTFARAAMTKMPGLNLGTGTTAFSDMSFRALLKGSAEATTADSFVALAASAFSDTSFDETKITSPGYTAAFGADPYDAIESMDGFRVEFALSFREHTVDRYGLVQMRLSGIQVTARFTPTGLTEAQWDALVIPDGADAVIPGQSLAKAGTDLVISEGAGSPKVTISKAGIETHGLVFGEAERFSELSFINKWTWTAGVLNAPFTVEIQSA